MTARLTLEYDGTDFAGWATQPGRRTVQAEVERALATLLRTEVSLTVAGRTDAGVHARGQVASYAGEPAPLRGLNGLLPRDVRVVASEAAPDGFDARRDALSRSYEYRLCTRDAPPVFERRYVLHWPHRLDLGALQECARALVGTHDLTAFTPSETYHVNFERTVLAAAWEPAGDELRFAIEAPAFMRSMNRVLVGTMLEGGGGRRSVESFVSLLAGAPRAAAGATAPAHGLCLTRVRYP